MVAVVDDLALVDVAVAGLHFAVALLPKPALLLHYSILDCHCLVFVAYCNDHPYSTYTTDTGKKTPSLQLPRSLTHPWSHQN